MAPPRTYLRETVCSACSVSWGCIWCSESCSCSWWRERLGTVQRPRRTGLRHRCLRRRKCSREERFMLTTLWFCLAAITITGYVLLDGFDLGAGIVQLFVTRTERETTQVLRSIGPVWDGNEVWLLVSGPRCFLHSRPCMLRRSAAFILSLMMVLWLLILRGVSIEFRSHIDSVQW